MAKVKKTIFCFILSLMICLGFSAKSEAAGTRVPRINVKSLSIIKGSTYKINIYNTKPDYVTKFVSTDNNIISVKKPNSKSCKLKAKTFGTTMVVAKVYDSEEKLVAELKCKVTVSPQAISVKFTKKKVKLEEGETTALKTIIKPNISKEKPKFTSDNTDVCTISSTGIVSAVGEGQATVYATLLNGKSAKCIVQVIPSKDAKPTKDPVQTKNPKPSKEPSPSSEPSIDIIATAEPAPIHTPEPIKKLDGSEKAVSKE